MAAKNTELFIGLMAGTSLDAIDAVLVSFESTPVKILSAHSSPIPTTLKKSILGLCQSKNIAIDKLGQTDAELGELFAKTCLELIHKSNINTEMISAIGSHGQTIRHRPDIKHPFTLQIGDPNKIAALTGITTIADFRKKDMAYGGQGAPLAPAFHRYLFGDAAQSRWIINIGGIANITYLTQSPTIGFDTGPGNTLLDHWYQLHNNSNYYDKDGLWAASGIAHPELLRILLADSYFQKPFPKSTGREYFNLEWLHHHLKKIDHELTPQDIQATLLELTAQSIMNAIYHFNDKQGEIWLCGGGAKNVHLVERLQQLSKPYYKLQTTTAMGIDPQWIEACAFAWLARQTLHRLPGNIASVTGAKRECILGGIYLS